VIVDGDGDGDGDVAVIECKARDSSLIDVEPLKTEQSNCGSTRV
jgi:hypothetical protein